MNIKGCKSFVINYYERIVAVVVMLVLVIFSIILILRVTQLDTQLDEESKTRPQKKRVKLFDAPGFEKKLEEIKNPPQWTMPEVTWTDTRDHTLQHRLLVAPVMKELDVGILRIWDPKVEGGRQTSEGFPYEWLRKYKLRTDLPVGHTDPDQDGFTVAEEFSQKTDPKDPASSPDPALKLRWVSIQPRRFPFVFNNVAVDKIGPSYLLIRHDRPDLTYWVREGAVVPDKDYPEYRVVRFQKRTEKREDPTIKDSQGRPYVITREIEELVLQKGQDAHITLVKLKPRDTDDLFVRFKLLIDDDLLIPEQTVGSIFNLQSNKYEVLAIKKIDAHNWEVLIKRIDNGKTFTIQQLSSKDGLSAQPRPMAAESSN
jgi:hypothetical protein